MVLHLLVKILVPDSSDHLIRSDIKFSIALDIQGRRRGQPVIFDNMMGFEDGYMSVGLYAN